MNNLRAKKELIEWVKKNDPYLYHVALGKYRVEKGLPANGSISLAGWEDFAINSTSTGMMSPATSGVASSGLSTGGFFESLLDVAKNVIPAALQYKQQKKIMDMQFDRAKQGLPPADVASYTPVVKVDVGASKEMIANATAHGEKLANKVKPYLVIGGVVLSIFLLRKKLKKLIRG